MARADGGSILNYFKKGAAVEISMDEDGFRGSLYTGTVINPPKKESSKVLVEYDTIMVDVEGKRPQRDSLNLVQLRPSQPKENRRAFKFSDEVDAYYNDGWWEGVITEASVEKDQYKVFFRGTREQMEFNASELRLHREWVEGMWVPPLNPPETIVEFDGMTTLSSAEMVAGADEKVSEQKFNPGDLVETSSKEEGFEGAWFSAKVLEETFTGKYLIEYQKLRNDDDTGFLREETDGANLRPYPPDIGLLDSFTLNDEVDALYNDGWWAGVIVKVLKNDNYFVYFPKTDERLKFEHSELRVHQEWRNGKWCTANKDLGQGPLNSKKRRR